MSNQLPDPSTLIPATVMNAPSPKDRETVKRRLAIMLRHTARLQFTEAEYAKETFPEPLDGTIHVLDGVSDRHLPLLIDLFFEFYQDLDKEFERTVRKDRGSNFDKYSGMLDRSPTSKSNPKSNPKSSPTHPAKRTVKKASLSPREKLLAKQEKLREQQAELDMDDDAIEKEMRARLGL